MKINRTAVLRHRIHVQGLTTTGPSADCPILDIGVQDTGPDGAAWALELRGHRPDPDDTVLVWTLRGAPHLYRRSEVAAVAAATAPFSEADARKRIFDASKPLSAAGIDTLDGLRTVASTMREIVTTDTVKGDLSAELTARLPEPYLRYCRPCDATHCYEQPFRLSALQAGLELVPDSSPPVLRRIRGWRGPARRVPAQLDVVRAVLHLLGPADPKAVAGYLDAPVAEVRRRWPEDTSDVEVDGQRLSILAEDRAALLDAPRTRQTRLLGPFDLYLQARDRERLVPDAAARKDLWRTLGRPGGLLVGGELVGSWRPRSAGRKLAVAVTLWDGSEPTAAMAEQAERLATWRGKEFAGLV